VAPVAAGVLSALGLAVSERRRDLVESVLLTGESLTREAVAAVVDRLAVRGRAELGAPEAELRATYELRYQGQAFELPIAGELAPEPRELRTAFDRAHAERYGYEDADARLELVTVRVAAALPGSEPSEPRAGAAEHLGTRRARFGESWHETQLVGSGTAHADGPAILALPGSTLVVPPGWTAQADAEAVVMVR